MTSPPLPDHLLRPHLRPIQPMPVVQNNRQLVALRDPAMMMQQMMVVPPNVLQILQHFQGRDTLDEIAARFQSSRDQLMELTQGLDRFGLLWGPTFERLETERLDKLRNFGFFPPRVTTILGADAESCRQKIQEYFDQAEDPELEYVPRGVIAPHLDYDRGWPNYAAAWYAWRNVEPPDLVVVLGTNHFGNGADSVVLSEFGFRTPLGSSPADSAIIAELVERLGDRLTAEQLDHFGEHSIELQIPWIQHCFGEVPVLAALVPDPLIESADLGFDDDGAAISLESFVESLRDVLEKKGRKTYFVASSDLSHVGPQFGEPRPVDDQRKLDVERHDRDMMGKYITGDAEEFLAAMRWTKNPTRWCSIGNMTALLLLTQPEEVELIDYRQACDERGAALVSSAAIVVE